MQAYILRSFLDLEKLYLDDDYDGPGNMHLYPSDSHLRFLNLRRITLAADKFLRAGSDTQGVFSIARKLFSPSNMPNLRHLAINDDGYDLDFNFPTLVKATPQVSTLAIRYPGDGADKIFCGNYPVHNIRHLSLSSVESDSIRDMLDLGRVELDSLHLSGVDFKRHLPRLIRIAKGEDPRHCIKRIVIYGKKQDLKTKYRDLVDASDALEWREGPSRPPFEDFDGR